ncbi:MAG TPA: TlpA disulfide reductase family protein [Armatimonadota bacterium]|jgi:peroxiredoxin
MRTANRWLSVAAVGAAALLCVVTLRNTVQAETTGKVGQTLPAFSATDVNGKKVSLADYKGKVLLLDFWATWCVPCRGEVPHVVSAYKTYRSKGFEVLGVSLDRDKAALADYTKKNGMTWRQVYDKDSNYALAKKYNVEGIPSCYLIDGSTGKILAKDLRGDALGAAVKKAVE